jgi:hypothetical protein
LKSVKGKTERRYKLFLVAALEEAMVHLSLNSAGEYFELAVVDCPRLVMKPEQTALQNIDKHLEAAGWAVQDYTNLNLRQTR